jgi:uncharacterized membrane protein
MVQRPLHPVNTVFLAGTIPLFLGALLSDIAYASTYEIQWKNFASWLLVGGLVFGALALLAAVIEFFRARSRQPREVIYVISLLAAWILGLINALVHAGDAWASMPRGLILSAIVAALSIAATALRLSANGRVAAS